jgi:hypothetical protein
MSDRRKRRTREHIIADLSVNHVERLVLRTGWVVQRLNPDYGIDLFMETFDANGDIENGGVWFQLKATGTLKVRARSQAIPVRMEWRDLIFWLNERMPGILVIYDAGQDRAWWVYLQEVLRTMKRRQTTDRPAHTVTLRVPLTNVLDETAIRQFARFRDAVEARSEEEP